jgi:hypothetical protein
MPRMGAENATHGVQAVEGQTDPPQRFGFALLFSIGLIDSATRMAFLTFLPFLLTDKGESLPTVGFALSLVFAGGAVGTRFNQIVNAAFADLGGIDRLLRLERGIDALGRHDRLPLIFENKRRSRLETLAQRQTSALLVAADPFFFGHREKIVALAARYKLPAIYEWRDDVKGEAAEPGPTSRPSSGHRSETVSVRADCRGAGRLHVAMRAPAQADTISPFGT